MFKRFTSFLAVVCLTLTFVLPVSADERKQEIISSNTVVTSDNVNQVIKYLGFDPDDLIQTNKTTLDASITVGELKKAIDQLKQLPTEIQLEEVVDDVPLNLESCAKVGVLNFDHCAGSKALYYTTNLGGSFEIRYSATAQYSWSKFLSVAGLGVEVLDTDDNPFTTYQFDEEPEISAFVANNGNKITLNGKVVVASYLSLGNVGLIKVNQHTITTTKDWSASSELPACI